MKKYFCGGSVDSELEKQKSAHLSESLDICNKFCNSSYETKMSNSKAFKNNNLSIKIKLDIVLKEYNGKSNFSINEKVHKKIQNIPNFTKIKNNKYQVNICQPNEE